MKLPNFLIIGAMKAGTSACAHNLTKHPDIYIASKDDKKRCFLNEKNEIIDNLSDDYFKHVEIQFFNTKSLYDKGINWYSEIFENADTPLIGEKCPEYLYPNYFSQSSENLFQRISEYFLRKHCVYTYQRIHKYLPEVKLIILLRDPARRAFSHWNHIQNELPNWGKEFHHKSFYDSLIIGKYNSILNRGNYINYISDFRTKFASNQIYIGIQERILDKMEPEYNKIFKYLGLNILNNINYDILHERDYDDRKMDEKSFSYLIDYYRNSVNQLKDFLNDDLAEWNEY